MRGKGVTDCRMLTGMFLVHARLKSSGTRFPPDFADLVARCAQPDEGLRHSVFHADAPTGPVLGLFLSGPSLSLVESAARAVVERALDHHDFLSGILLVSCEAVLPTPYFEWLVERPDDGGRLMPPAD